MTGKPINIPVIYYHSVAPGKNRNWILGFLTLELQYFKDQLQYLLRHGYQTLFLEDYLSYERRDEELQSNAICLTFDDGYLDNWIYLFPLLKKYKMKATIFVNPEYVDPRPVVRKNLEDYWENKISLDEIDQWGFLSWDEMRLMEKSGCVDIQSHTLTHTKYFVSDQLVDVHRPGTDSLYVIANLFPERKPFYIEDPDFFSLIPFGFPKFKQKSALIARRVYINEEFNREAVEVLKDFDWMGMSAPEEILKKLNPLYQEYKKADRLIVKRESESEYLERITDELRLSKELIERNLGKKVNYCGWPHGDNNDLLHRKAMASGYKATTAGSRKCEIDDFDCIPRFGLGKCKNNRRLSILKTNYKLKSFQGKFPHYQINKLYNYFKYERKQYNY